MTELGIGVTVFGLIVAAGAALRAYGAYVRRRSLAALPDTAVRVRGFTMRVMARGRHGLPGIASGRTHRTTGDLGYTDERMLVTSNRGVLLDVRADGRRLASIRTTGPGKLIIEGETSGATGGSGQFRFELAIADPVPHVEALQGFTAAPGDRPTFATAFDPG